MKRIAVINFFPAFDPPSSGGELRYTRLARELARRFDVALYNPTHLDAPRESIEHVGGYVEHRFPKTRAYIAAHRFFDRAAAFHECSALVSNVVCRWHRDFARAAARAAREADIVVHACPFMLPVYPRPRRGQLFVYDSYNVEERMMRDALGRGAWGRWGTRRIRRMEMALLRRADVVAACSPGDAREYIERFGADPSRLHVVPNGVDVETVHPPSPDERRAARGRRDIGDGVIAALFFGSYHPPNREGVDFLLRHVAPAAPGVEFHVAGKVCDFFHDAVIPPNVRMLGLVPDGERADLLAGCDIALNPMFSGSGTNLKMLEYFAAGIPVVTTGKGARGLGIRDGVHAAIADAETFAAALGSLAGDAGVRERLAARARRHAEKHFGWRAIGQRYADVLDFKSSRRALVLVDYPITPEQSGGPVRVAALAREIARHGCPTTVLTLTKKPAGGGLRGGVEEINAPRSLAIELLDGVLHRLSGVGADDLSAALGWRLSKPFRRRLAREAQFAGAIIASHPFLGGAARSAARGTPVFHDSHNVETELKAPLYRPNVAGRALVRLTAWIERRAVAPARLIGCASEADRQGLIHLTGADPSRFVPAWNGVDVDRLRPLDPGERARLRAAAGIGTEPLVLFLGSAHPPNARAVEHVLSALAPAAPAASFLIMGGVVGWFVGRPLPENVTFLGFVDDHVRDFLLLVADLAVNPMFEGSGTNLKMLDYLAAGLPVLSTPVGARGVATADDGAIAICEADAMAARMAGLLADAAELERLRLAGRALAERTFDWSRTLDTFAGAVADTVRAAEGGPR